MSLLHSAIAVLMQPSCSAPDLAIAVAAVSEAVCQEVELPAGTAEALWAVLSQNPDASWATLAASSVGRIASAELVHEVLVAIMRLSSNRSLRVAALNVLSEDRAARFISDHALVELAQVAEQTGRTSQCSPVVAAVANTRKVTDEALDAIVVRWAASSDPRASIAAVEVLGIKGHATLEIVSRLLNDPDSTVRCVVAVVVRELLDRDVAREVLSAAIDREKSPPVRRVLRDELEALIPEAVF